MVKHHVSQTENDDAIVYDHFVNVSDGWSDRYGEQPRGMSDLDLVLRREHAQSLLVSCTQSLTSPVQVLDLGCGAGNALDGMSRERFCIRGLDPVPEMVRIAAANHPEDDYLVGQIERLPFESHSADVILCLGVLEYLADPLSALGEMHRVLQPGGHLIVSFPNRKSLFRKLSHVVTNAEHMVGSTIRKLRGRPRQEAPAEEYRHTQWTAGQVGQRLKGRHFHPKRYMFNTYGMWGRLGKNQLNLALSKRLTQRFCNLYPVGDLMACTILVLAERRHSPVEGQPAST